MAKTNFYLKNPKDTDETLIYLFFSYDGNRLKFSTEEKVEPKHWNLESQRVKKSKTGSLEINNRLDKIESEVRRIYREAKLNNEEPSNELIRERLEKVQKPIEVEQKLDFYTCFKEFLQAQAITKTKRTVQKYETLQNHLLKFQEFKKTRITFENIDPKFYDDLVSFFISEKGMVNNSISKYVKTLKTFLLWASERGYNNNQSFKKFKATEKDADIVYLTDEELFKLYNFDFSNNPVLERVRDVFCFGCFTGLRFSDIARVNKSKVINDEIRLISEKTTELLQVPLNDYSKEILEKYSYQLPVISNQKTNLHLKDLCKLAGIEEEITLTTFKGAVEIKRTQPKHRFIGTHTARRTFVTLSLEKGMRHETVMGIVGHKGYNTFKKYIKLTSKVKAIEMNKFWKKEVKEIDINN